MEFTVHRIAKVLVKRDGPKGALDTLMQGKYVPGRLAASRRLDTTSRFRGSMPPNATNWGQQKERDVVFLYLWASRRHLIGSWGRENTGLHGRSFCPSPTADLTTAVPQGSPAPYLQSTLQSCFLTPYSQDWYPCFLVGTHPQSGLQHNHSISKIVKL